MVAQLGLSLITVVATVVQMVAVGERAHLQIHAVYAVVGVGAVGAGINTVTPSVRAHQSHHNAEQIIESKTKVCASEADCFF